MIISRTIGPVDLDCVVKDWASSELTITTQPVEIGADVADHAYLEPERLLVEAYMGGRIGGPQGRDAIMAAYGALRRLQGQREPITIVSGLSVHRDMLIHKVEPQRDAETEGTAKFVIECQQIILAETTYSAARVANAPATGQARGLSSGKASGKVPKSRAAKDTVRGDAAVSTTTPPATSGSAGGGSAAAAPAAGGTGSSGSTAPTGSLLHRLVN